MVQSIRFMDGLETLGGVFGFCFSVVCLGKNNINKQNKQDK